MKTSNNSSMDSTAHKLSVKELEVLWLMDCQMSDFKIADTLFMNLDEFGFIKNSLFESFKAVNKHQLMEFATDQGYIH